MFVMRISKATTIISSLLSLLSGYRLVAGSEWMHVAPNIEFQSKMDSHSSNTKMIRATNLAINRMLSSQKQQSYSAFDTSSYSLGMEDFNQDWDSAQLAWHLLGFYIDCNGNDDGGDDHHRRELQEDHHEDHHDDREGDNTCRRKVLYAVYVDPNYQGGGIGEYEYYDQDSGEYKCYGGNCRTKMDCHSSDSESWQLVGIFKINKISQGDGWMEQLFKHAGVCYWGGDNYSFASKMRETLPNGCKQTNYKSNGNYLYVDVKPAQNAYISLALYTDKTCTKLYTGTDYDAYTAAGTSSDDMATFNTLLNGYRTCQPCVAYDLSQDDFTCYDDAGYTNCNQCMKFAIKAGCTAATAQEIKLAHRQSGILPIGNLTDSVEMSSVKMLESEVVNETIKTLPHYLEASVLFFLGCLTFYFTPAKEGSNSRRRSPLLKANDDESAETEEGSIYANSPPVSPTGLIVNCDPMRPKNLARSSLQLPGSFNKSLVDGDLSESDGQYQDEPEQSDYTSESDNNAASNTENYRRGNYNLNVLNQTFK